MKRKCSVCQKLLPLDSINFPRDKTKPHGFAYTCKPCTYCGDTQEEIGCDRIDNSKGHTKDNVVPACKTCNVSRMDNFTHEEMLVLGKTIKQIKINRTNLQEAA